MVALPTDSPTVEAIYKWYAEQKDHRRTYLGGSEIGHECRRRLWYSFRWVARPSFPGRIKRLFETGHREEDRLIANLRAVGVEVLEKDPDTGEQWEIVACDGHVRGHLDGVLLGLLEAPKTWHLLECKSMNKRRFDILEKDGCQKAEPVYYAQQQIYMGETGLKRSAFFVQCKDDDRLYLERIKYDSAEHKALMVKASAVIKAESPPDRIGKDPSFFKCKFCPYVDYCFGKKFPEVNCRTCAHSTPIKDGQWSCARALPMYLECQEHIFLPPLLHWATPIDGDPTWVLYEEDGKRFVNCAATGFAPHDVESRSSNDLHAKGLPAKGG